MIALHVAIVSLVVHQGAAAHRCSPPLPADADVTATAAVDGRAMTDVQDAGLTSDFLGRGTWAEVRGQRRTAPVCVRAVAMRGRHRVRVKLEW